VSTQYQCEYFHGAREAESFPAPLRNGNGTVTIALAKQDIVPGAFEMTWNVDIHDYDAISTTRPRCRW